ncbi:MAG TPA: alpha/beta hydrolase [Bryobacteraceae bacterium]|nr:alpha/beta hydrolase [Bryobacteraceae bacterium]
MKSIYKSREAERAVRERYAEILKQWPVPCRHLRVPTREGETFVIASGAETAPPLLVFHGSVSNSASSMFDVAVWAAHFRVYAVDMIGEPGFSPPSRPKLASDAHALWLDDVLRGLALERASILGVSLGGWLALDYATRRPERVESLAVLCPGGVGRQKLGFRLKAIPLLRMGRWGTRRLSKMILGGAPANLASQPPAVQAFVHFVSLVHQSTRSRNVKLPVFSDEALQRLDMPLLAIMGGKDVLLDSAETKRRLEANVQGAEVRYLPETGHFIPGQAAVILDFLRSPAGAVVY